MLLDEIDDALLARFVAGTATEADLAEIKRWIAAAPERNAELAVIRELAQLATALPSSRRVRAMWESLESRLDEPEEKLNGVDRAAREPRRLGLVPSASRPRWRPRLRAGAAHLVFALALIGVLTWRVGQEAPVDTAETVEMTREVQTSRGEKMRLKLLDGTQVDLGPESSLHMRYVANGPRELTLEGEAIFDVTHDPNRPFRVRSGNAVTEDLGTVFGVRAYPGEGEVRVIVSEGVVVLRPAEPGEVAVLHPGDVGRLDAQGRIETESGVNVDAYLGWAVDRLFYEHVPLREIANDLERAYDVTILIPDSTLAASRVTLDLQAATLAEVLHAIAVPLQIRQERAGQTFVLRR